MRLSIVTDELSADIETALELATGMGVGAVELRGIGEGRFPQVDSFWQARVPELIEEAGVSVAALSPGLFKIPYPFSPSASTRILRWEDAMLFRRHQDADALVRRHLEELLPAAIEAAQQVGTKTIVAFSFDRVDAAVGPMPDAAVDVLRDAAATVGLAGLSLAIEVEHVCYGDTARRTADIVERVDHPALGINWDPANAYRAGDDLPFPDGYAAVRNHVRHVHFKDAWTDPASGHREFVINGVIDWKGQIAALRDDGYDGFVSVETHARPKIEMTRRTVERVRELGVDQ
jgi:sugar phosphate isomerase/epimerase